MTTTGGIPHEHDEYEVIGWDNGGVELIHTPCDTTVASGGCDCCKNNNVTLRQLTDATTTHTCEETNTA